MQKQTNVESRETADFLTAEETEARDRTIDGQTLDPSRAILSGAVATRWSARPTAMPTATYRSLMAEFHARTDSIRAQAYGVGETAIALGIVRGPRTFCIIKD